MRSWEEDFTLSDLKFKSGKVTGTLKNVSGRDFEYVQIEITALDSEGAVVESTLANVSNFKSKEMWKWKPAVFDDEAKSVNIRDVVSR